MLESTDADADSLTRHPALGRALRIPLAFAAIGRDRRCVNDLIGWLGTSHALKRADQVAIGAFLLLLGLLKLVEQVLDAVERSQDERHCLAAHRRAGAKLAHERLGSMCQRFEPRQCE